MIVPPTISLNVLHDSLIAAGIALVSLQRTGSDVERQLVDGSIVDLPPEAQAVIDAITADQAAAAAAQSLDQPVTDLASARTSYATDATALANAKTAVTNANATVQSLAASPSIANLTAAVKALSTAQAQADLAILASLKDLADGELAIANALAALKARG